MLRTGFLFVASEFSNQYVTVDALYYLLLVIKTAFLFFSWFSCLFQFKSIGDDEMETDDVREVPGLGQVG